MWRHLNPNSITSKFMLSNSNYCFCFVLFWWNSVGSFDVMRLLRPPPVTVLSAMIRHGVHEPIDESPIRISTPPKSYLIMGRLSAIIGHSKCIFFIPPINVFNNNCCYCIDWMQSKYVIGTKYEANAFFLSCYSSLTFEWVLFFSHSLIIGRKLDEKQNYWKQEESFNAFFVFFFSLLSSKHVS